MFDLFKMYCYKMIRQKSLYVIWLIMFGFELLTVLTTVESFAEISVEMGGFYILFVSIFSAIFFSADMSSGFIKNYAGSISHRSTIIVSRIAMLLVQNLFTQAVMFVSLFVLALFKGVGPKGDSFTAKYYISMFLTGFACSVLGMMFTELIRKTIPAMILTIAVGMGLVSQLSATISCLISNCRFNISNYMVTGMFNQLNTESVSGDYNAMFFIAICYMILSAFISIVSIEKQDIV